VPLLDELATSEELRDLVRGLVDERLEERLAALGLAPAANGHANGNGHAPAGEIVPPMGATRVGTKQGERVCRHCRRRLPEERFDVIHEYEGARRCATSPPRSTRSTASGLPEVGSCT
jgi:hypothetical protein